MEFLVNDLSLSGQYTDVQSFQSALARLMKMKRIVRQYGMEFLCHRNLASAPAVQNFWEVEALETFCKETPVLLNSWDQLQEIAEPRFLHLFFSEDAFAPLKGHPFIHGAAHRLIALCQILNRFKACHDVQGKRTKEGHELYQNFFTGKKGGGGKGALFKDSSDAEKSGIPFKVLDDDMKTSTGKLSICTMHLAKGLEFRAVAVMACDDEIIPLQERMESVSDDADLEEVYDTERHLLYVACTRARDYLLVSSVDPASEFLDDLRL